MHKGYKKAEEKPKETPTMPQGEPPALLPATEEGDLMAFLRILTHIACRLATKEVSAKDAPPSGERTE